VGDDGAGREQGGQDSVENIARAIKDRGEVVEESMEDNGPNVLNAEHSAVANLRSCSHKRKTKKKPQRE